MTKHESVDRLYGELHKSNPLISGFAQITMDKHRQILIDLGYDVSTYDIKHSLLFEAFTEAKVKYVNNVPAITRYRIIFAVGKKIPDRYIYKRKNSFYDEYTFYPFFLRNPSNVKDRRHDDYYCQEHMRKNICYWCPRCRGSVGEIANLSKLMYRKSVV